MMENIFRLIIKWSGKEYEISDLTENDTVSNLKASIYKVTNVRPDRQKLLNLKLKGKPPEDECRLSQLSLKPGFKIMMIGSLEEDIAEVSQKPEDIPEVVNDLDIEEEEIAIENQEIYLSKIERRIKEYEIKMLSEPRPGKKLLVLDIDYTLFDHRSVAQTGNELMRPYLHEFLTECYEYYDIVIWSATSMKWIDEKMKLLGVSTNQNYKILFHLDHLAMISVHTPKYGLIDVKPLGVIWGKFEQYSPANTIMLDDIRRNFIMNPKNGLRIRPFAQAHLNREKDKELFYLTKYLIDIAVHVSDFTAVNHKNWEKFNPKKYKKNE